MAEYDVALKTIHARGRTPRSWPHAALVAARRVTIPRNDEAPVYLGAAFTEASDHVLYLSLTN